MANLTITAADVAPVVVNKQESGYSGEDLTAGQWARLDTTSGSWVGGNASSAAEAHGGGLVMASALSGFAVTIMIDGIMDLGDALSALTFDDDVFLSNTDKTLADTAGTVSKIVGTVVPSYGQGGPGATRAKLLKVGG